MQSTTNKESEMNTNSLMNIANRPDIVFEQGNGDWLQDSKGRKYLDFVQGWAVNCLGHCNPEIVSVIEKQANTLINCSPAFYNNKMILLADQLTDSSCFDEVFFTNSGAEANEGAIKLARKWGEKNKNGAYEIITFANAFHGRTLTTMAASGKQAFEPLFNPKTPGFKKSEFNDISSVKDNVSNNTVAIMIELIQGEAGVIESSLKFIDELVQLCKQEKLLLIVDEVQTGIGRTGSLFAYQNYNIEPDIMTLGKGLGSGVPIGALVAKSSVSCFDHGDQGGTYNGNPLVCAVSSVVLDTVSRESFLLSVKDKGNILKEGLSDISKKYNHKEVRGKGLLLALELSKPIANEVAMIALQEFSILINACSPTTIRIMPALNVGVDSINLFLHKLDSVFSYLNDSDKVETI